MVRQVALKDDLADAMATCEELDQTVTDLTNELHAKDEQRGYLETRVVELERELGSRTQSLEDQVSKAKTSASSLAAKLADTTAELRASNGRLEDASAKVKAAQEREEVLREEIASLREGLSELNSTTAELSHDISDREAQLEEALAATQLLRAEQSRLQEKMETSTTRLAAEVATGRAAGQAAAAREEALQGELRVERETVAGAVVAVSAAAAVAEEAAGKTPPGEGDPERAVLSSPGAGEGSIDAGGGSGGGGGGDGGEGEGEGGGSPASARSSSTGRGGGQREGQSSGEPLAAGVAAGGAGKSGAAVISGQPSARERELEEEVASLKATLRAARGVGSNGGRGGGGEAAGLGGKGSSVAVVLESGDIGAVKRELRSLASLYGKEKYTNASLLSKIRALRGNIEVICRIRPPTTDETASGVPMALEALGEGEVGVKTSKDAGRPGGGGGATTWRSFSLDKALGPSTTQEEVFRQVEPLALSAADGLNACIFAYGQTGSGKTHTMIGDAKGGDMAGVSYRTMNKLFQVLELRRAQQLGYVFTVTVAMLEIYNEEVRDLLSSSESSQSSAGGTGGGDGGAEGGGDGGGAGGSGGGAWNGGKLEIRRDQDGKVQVPGLTKVTVTSAEEVLTLLERGGGARAVAATGVHDHSSRSHSVLLAEVACRAGADALPSTGRLFLVDLAGSERIKVSGVTGAGLREATNINSSLSALGDVMQALDQKQKHVPYRNSKLTFLLQ
ncbi:unnamed protein product, partial [Laminaria digitata]